MFALFLHSSVGVSYRPLLGAALVRSSIFLHLFCIFLFTDTIYCLKKKVPLTSCMLLNQTTKDNTPKHKPSTSLYIKAEGLTNILFSFLLLCQKCPCHVQLLHCVTLVFQLYFLVAFCIYYEERRKNNNQNPIIVVKSTISWNKTKIIFNLPGYHNEQDIKSQQLPCSVFSSKTTQVPKVSMGEKVTKS